MRRSWASGYLEVASSKRGLKMAKVWVGEEDEGVEMVMGEGEVVGIVKLVLEVATVESSVEGREALSAISCCWISELRLVTLSLS